MGIGGGVLEVSHTCRVFSSLNVLLFVFFLCRNAVTSILQCGHTVLERIKGEEGEEGECAACPWSSFCPCAFPLCLRAILHPPVFPHSIFLA